MKLRGEYIENIGRYVVAKIQVKEDFVLPGQLFIEEEEEEEENRFINTEYIIDLLKKEFPKIRFYNIGNRWISMGGKYVFRPWIHNNITYIYVILDLFIHYIEENTLKRIIKALRPIMPDSGNKMNVPSPNIKKSKVLSSLPMNVLGHIEEMRGPTQSLNNPLKKLAKSRRRKGGKRQSRKKRS